MQITKIELKTLLKNSNIVKNNYKNYDNNDRKYTFQNNIVNLRILFRNFTCTETTHSVLKGL